MELKERPQEEKAIKCLFWKSNSNIKHGQNTWILFGKYQATIKSIGTQITFNIYLDV